MTISTKSIIIEYLTSNLTLFQLSSLTLSAISITLAGLMLLLLTIFYFKRKKDLLLLARSWKNLLIASVSLAIGIFTWYDSIGKIGSSKEMIIA